MSARVAKIWGGLAGFCHIWIPNFGLIIRFRDPRESGIKHMIKSILVTKILRVNPHPMKRSREIGLRFRRAARAG